MKRSGSLKTRLTALTVVAVAAIWLGTALFTWFEARHEIDELLDGHLAQAASLLSVQAGHELDEIDTEHAPLLHKRARKLAFQVWEERKEGRILRLHSLNAPSTPLGGGKEGHEGFSEVEVEGERWRVFSTWTPDREMLIHVAERADVRDEMAADLAAGLLKPFAFALPVLALLLWLAVAYGLGALKKVAAEVARRAPDNLSALDTTAMPAEILPLAGRLNELFARLARSLDGERRFTADAAHELRTPLAGIRAQAQVALGASGDAERRHALEAVLAGCDRAARLVEQLLTLARIDTHDNARSDKRIDAQPDATPAGSAVALRALAAATLADLAAEASAKNIDLALADGEELAIPGHDGLLRVLLRNLADNAIRYSPPGSTVEIHIGHENGRPTIAVIDNGPGIAAAERERVLERFYRVLGSGAEGSGLGLSIVRRIVDLHGASLDLRDGPDGRGLAVRVSFPLPPR